MMSNPFTYVYVIGRVDDTGPVKIGISTNSKNRLSGVQTGSHTRLAIKFEKKVAANCGNDVERNVHKTLREHRLTGEWFNVAAEIAIKTIEEIAVKVEKQKQSQTALPLEADTHPPKTKHKAVPTIPVIRVPNVELVHKVTSDEKISLDRYIERKKLERRQAETAPFRNRMIEGKRKKAAERLANAALSKDIEALQNWLAKGASS